jgi:hypothetical protein
MLRSGVDGFLRFARFGYGAIDAFSMVKANGLAE